MKVESLKFYNLFGPYHLSPTLRKLNVIEYTGLHLHHSSSIENKIKNQSKINSEKMRQDHENLKIKRKVQSKQANFIV
jgi:hypothetical protein